MTTPFDFTKSITQTKEYLIKSNFDEEEYVPWVVNRSLSVHPDTVFYVQEMNLNSHLDKKMQYDFLYYGIKKGRRPFIKYPKKEKSDMIAIVMELYKYNVKKAKATIAVLSDEQLEKLKDFYFKGG